MKIQIVLLFAILALTLGFRHRNQEMWRERMQMGTSAQNKATIWDDEYDRMQLGTSAQNKGYDWGMYSNRMQSQTNDGSGFPRIVQCSEVGKEDRDFHKCDTVDEDLKQMCHDSPDYSDEACEEVFSDYGMACYSVYLGCTTENGEWVESNTVDLSNEFVDKFLEFMDYAVKQFEAVV